MQPFYRDGTLRARASWGAPQTPSTPSASHLAITLITLRPLEKNIPQHPLLPTSVIVRQDAITLPITLADGKEYFSNNGLGEL